MIYYSLCSVTLMVGCFVAKVRGSTHTALPRRVASVAPIAPSRGRFTSSRCDRSAEASKRRSAEAPKRRSAEAPKRFGAMHLCEKTKKIAPSHSCDGAIDQRSSALGSIAFLLQYLLYVLNLL